MSKEVEMHLAGRVLSLNPLRRVATVKVPGVGGGRNFRAAYADPGESLARVVEWEPGVSHRRVVGSVTAVRPRPSGCEVDVHITGDEAWQRLADRGAHVDVHCSFDAIGLDPTGGRVQHVEVS